MIELVAEKLSSGDAYVGKSKAHLKRDEWGMAYQSIVAALRKGNLSEADEAVWLYRDICRRLGLSPRLKTAAPTTQWI